VRKNEKQEIIKVLFRCLEVLTPDKWEKLTLGEWANLRMNIQESIGKLSNDLK